MADVPMYRIKYKDKLIEVHLNDLSNQRLREMKRRFGRAYGTPQGLIELLGEGDFDAISCMIWVGQQKPGWKGPVEDPLEMEFSLGDLVVVPPTVEESEEEDEKPKRPTKAASKSTSEPTSANSETSTSLTSETSSD